MAVTSSSYTGNGSTVDFTIGFPYIKKADVKVYVSGVLQTLTTHYTFNTSNIIRFVTAPAASTAVLIDRVTDSDSVQAVFSPGSAIPAEDLNKDFNQTLYIAQEIVDDASAANANSAAALASVSQFLPYTIVAAVANIPGAPTSGQRVEVTNSTGIQSFSPLSGLPGGFIGAVGIRVRLQWDTPVASTWNWTDYLAVDPDGRYIRPSQLSSSLVDPSATTGANVAGLKALQDAKAPIASPTFTGTPTVPQLNGGQLAGLRNRIICGSMLVDQRHAGASKTITAAAALAYTADRWYGYCTGANVTGQRITVAGTINDPFRYQFTGAASVTGIGIGQRIEAVNCRDLAGTTATLSASFSNSLLTTVNWQAFYANTNDTFGTLASPTRTSIASGSFTVNSTYTRYSAQISIPAAATTGIEIVFTVGAQTSGTWVIGSVQLESGSVATPFEQRPQGLELMLCQRYYTTTRASSRAWAVGGGQKSSNYIYLPVTMRVAPTAAGPTGASDLNVTAAALLDVLPTGARFEITAAGANDFYGLNGLCTFDAEL
jgi:hypothetical protein